VCAEAVDTVQSTWHFNRDKTPRTKEPECFQTLIRIPSQLVVSLFPSSYLRHSRPAATKVETLSEVAGISVRVGQCDAMGAIGLRYNVGLTNINLLVRFVLILFYTVKHVKCAQV